MAVFYVFPQQHEVDAALRRAIEERLLVTFTLHGLPRRAEPHDYGIMKGVPKLFFYQVGGRSQSGQPIGWRWARVSELTELVVLDEGFRGARDTDSGRHVEWDRLIASVSAGVRQR